MKKKSQGSFGGSITFGAAPDSDLTEEDARDVIGPALLEIAEKNKIADVRSLSKKLVYDEVREVGKSHALWKHIFHVSEKEAAEKYFIERCHVLIRSIVIVPLSLKQSHRERAFVPASEVLQHASGGGFTRKPAHVLREDALRSDPEYFSVLGGGIRRFITAFEWVEAWCSKREQSLEVAALLTVVRDAVDDYRTSIKRDAAE